MGRKIKLIGLIGTYVCRQDGIRHSTQIMVIGLIDHFEQSPMITLERVFLFCQIEDTQLESF